MVGCGHVGRRRRLSSSSLRKSPYCAALPPAISAAAATRPRWTSQTAVTWTSGCSFKAGQVKASDQAKADQPHTDALVGPQHLAGREGSEAQGGALQEIAAVNYGHRLSPPGQAFSVLLFQGVVIG